MIYGRHRFGKTLKKKVFLGVGKLGLIKYLAIFLCLFQNCFSVSELNFLLIFFLFLLICSVHKWYFSVRLKGIGWTSTNVWFGPSYIIESSGGDNSSSLCTCVSYFSVLYFSCCIKRTSLSATSYSTIRLEDFWSESKEETFLWVEQLGLIHYLVICLCLFQKYLSVRKLNFLLLFLLLLLNSNLSVVLGWFRHIYLLLPSLH